jgi:predicted transcriptional regulator
MKTWNIKTNDIFQEEWNEHKDDHSTEGYELKYIFKIYLPFWECKQNVVVEKELELDRFSKIILDFIYDKKSSLTDICRFLGIEEDNFCVMQLSFLERNNLVRCVAPDDSYEITHNGIDFLKNKKKLKTTETEEFEYTVIEKYSFLENDMTMDFFNPSRPIDSPQLSDGKNAEFSGYNVLQIHLEEKEKIEKTVNNVFIKHNNRPTYRKVMEKQNDFSVFYNTMNPNKIFYDFADDTVESHRRNICFLGFWYENDGKKGDIKVDIRQFKNSVKIFKEHEIERKLSKKVMEYVLKNDVRFGDSSEKTTADTIEKYK